MKVVVAPDSFKSSLSSTEVIESIVRGIRRVDSSVEIVAIPFADGGEGTVEALVNATSGTIYEASVRGPLGEDVSAIYGILGDGETGVLEIASASGIELYRDKTPDPLKASSYGTGQLMEKLIQRDCRRIIVGLGGSATNDGGAGIAAALGVRFLNSSDEDIPLGGEGLLELERIDISNMNPALRDIEVLVACDVTNCLCGPEGASAVYGPQKGATPRMVEVLDRALKHYSSIIEKDLDIDVSIIPGGGAAGGAGAGLIAFCNASLRSGIDIICDLVDFEEQIVDADLIITGEGKIDSQTCRGKTISGLARRARAHDVPLIALGGSIDINAIEGIHEMGVAAVFNINPAVATLEESLRRAPENIEFTVSQIMRLLKHF